MWSKEAGGPNFVKQQKTLGHMNISNTQVHSKIYPPYIIKMHQAYHPGGKAKKTEDARMVN